MKPVSQMTNAELAAELSETATTMHPVMQTEKTLLREAASRLQAPAVAERELPAHLAAWVEGGANADMPAADDRDADYLRHGLREEDLP